MFCLLWPEDSSARAGMRRDDLNRREESVYTTSLMFIVHGRVHVPTTPYVRQILVMILVAL